MGLDTIPDRADETFITQDWYNVLESVLMQDFYPRDSSGVVTDEAGSLGQLALAWMFLHLMGAYFYDSGFAVSISAPSGMSSDYALSLPLSLPGSGNRLLKINPDGSSSFFDVDGSSLEIATGTLQVKDGGVTRAMLAAPNSGLSDSTGVDIVSAGSSNDDVINLEVSGLVTTGRPVLLAIIHDQSTDPAWLDQEVSNFEFEFVRDGTTLGRSLMGSASVPGTLIFIDDTVTAGTHDYKIQATTTDTANISGLKLYAREM